VIALNLRIMAAVIVLIVVLVALAVTVMAAISVLGRGSNWLRVVYVVFMMIAVVAAYFTTFQYVYFENENTRFHGWPVPMVIWQREGPDEPWRDFVGTALFFAFPLNLLFYAVLPSSAAWLLAALRPRIRPGNA
jgi:hypothetical protein